MCQTKGFGGCEFCCWFGLVFLINQVLPSAAVNQDDQERALGRGEMAQWVMYLPCKCENLCSVPTTHDKGECSGSEWHHER